MMHWRVTAQEWQPDQMRVMDRRGARKVDQEENRRRLTANEMNALMAIRSAFWLEDMALPDLEKQARHVGVWGRMKAIHTQMQNIMRDIFDKTSLEQLISIKNNTQHVKISIQPELVTSDPELTIQPMKNWDRSLAASLAYCQYCCDGTRECQRECKLKKMLDDNCFIEACNFQPLVGGQCKYNMVDFDWESIRKEW